MKIFKQCAVSLISIASFTVLTMAGCAVDPVSDPEFDELSGIEEEEGELVDNLSAGKVCGADVGTIWGISKDPNSGAVDVSQPCLNKINEYRKTKNLKPYWLRTGKECCESREAKAAAIKDGHALLGCGGTSYSQAYCGGGRNPNGTVAKSVPWCPKLIFDEGPTGGHYQAMMRTAPRAISCSYYAINRDKHAILINYY